MQHLALLAVSGVLLAAGVQWVLQQDVEVKSPPAAPNLPTIEAEDVQRIVLREAGQKVWEFAARRITITPDRLYAVATGVHRAVYFRDHKPYLQLKAQHVRLNQQTRDMTATGAVGARGPDGFALQTRCAQWMHQQQRLLCPEAVQVQVRDLTVRTTGVVYNAREGQLRCPQRVEVTAPRAVLRGENAVADVKAQRVHMTGATEIIIDR